MPPSISPQSAEQSLSLDKMTFWKSYLHAFSGISKRLDETLRFKAGIRLEDYKVLTLLAHGSTEARPRAVRMGELSTQMSVLPSKLTYQVERLISKGWVRRARVEKDRRGKEIFLTPKGFTKFEEASAVRDVLLDKHIFSHLSQEEASAFAETLHKINNGLA